MVVLVFRVENGWVVRTLRDKDSVSGDTGDPVADFGVKRIVQSGSLSVVDLVPNSEIAEFGQRF